MNKYFIQSFKIKKLWGYRDIDLTFHKDVNILIGPNGSGKTTVLHLLHSILSLDCQSILNAGFNQAEIKVRDFEDSSVRTVEVEISDKLLNFRLDEKEQDIGVITAAKRRIPEPYVVSSEGDRISPKRLLQQMVKQRILSEDLCDELTSLVPITWLPVSRCLSLTEDEEEWYTRTELLELMDLRLEDLLAGLSRHHSILNAQLSERYRGFERQVLSAILYNKEHDQFRLIRNSTLHSFPTKVEKAQLLGAFEAAGLLDGEMKNRIDDHFAAAERVVKRIGENIDKNIGLDLEDVLVLPLVRRTQAMVEYAEKLEEDRKCIFAPLRLYEEIVNSFLDDKFVEIDGSGQLKIKLSSSLELDWQLLSSGEKQILILLTEALLKIDEPVVYIADEPELSLHVTWQEQLLKSLVKLGGQKQIIVATHSPDIVADFRDKVIDLGRKS